MCQNSYTSLFEFYLSCFYPQQNRTMSWAVKIRKNIDNGYTVE